MMTIPAFILVLARRSWALSALFLERCVRRRPSAEFIGREGDQLRGPHRSAELLRRGTADHRLVAGELGRER